MGFRVARRLPCPSRWLGAHQPRDRGGGFGQLHLRVVSSLRDCLGHAVVKVILEEVQRHRPQTTIGCADLGEDIDAIFVGVDHLCDATTLALNAAQSACSKNRRQVPRRGMPGTHRVARLKGSLGAQQHGAASNAAYAGPL